MSDTYTLPSLDSAGWTNDPATILDKAFSYFVISDHSQSDMYFGNISSLPYQLYQAGNDLELLSVDLQTELATYLKRYFDDVSVQIEIKQNLKDQLYRMRLFVGVNVKGSEYTLDKILTYDNSSIKSVNDLL